MWWLVLLLKHGVGILFLLFALYRFLLTFCKKFFPAPCGIHHGIEVMFCFPAKKRARFVVVSIYFYHIAGAAGAYLIIQFFTGNFLKCFYELQNRNTITCTKI